MKSILYITAPLIISVSFLLGLPSAVALVQSQISANNIPSNPVWESYAVAGIQKRIPLPEDKGVLPPLVSATAALVLDLDSESLLFVKDPNKRVPIASTTKIMTALIALSYFKSEDVLTVPSQALVPGSNMGLKIGEKLTFRSLLYGMMLNSGNDAAFTIAANFPGGVPSFVGEMNKKALELGLANTHFDNPAGFDSQYHYSSALDLGKIASLVPDSLQLSRVVATKEVTVVSASQQGVYQLKNLNKLLSLPGVLGIKTGTTPQAKENLVGLVERDGHKILTVILGSNDRFRETEALIDWAYTNFNWE